MAQSKGDFAPLSVFETPATRTRPVGHKRRKRELDPVAFLIWSPILAMVVSVWGMVLWALAKLV